MQTFQQGEGAGGECAPSRGRAERGSLKKYGSWLMKPQLSSQRTARVIRFGKVRLS